jgi:hypothetical protein
LDWTVLTSARNGPEIVLDLAQGLGRNVSTGLMEHASVVGFSFGVGKGVDTGGALLFSRNKTSFQNALPVSNLGNSMIWRSVLLRAVISLGLYGVVSGWVARLSEGDLTAFDECVRPIDFHRSSSFWLQRLQKFTREVQVARRRGAELENALRNSEALVGANVYFCPLSTHLRQIVRLADPRRRNSLLSTLRSAGIDCTAAGERPPWTYLTGIDARRFPNTRQFMATAIRLPFLGRLTEKEYLWVRNSLEANLA